MAPQPSVLLSLALCLGQLSPTWENGLQPPPSISALPDCKVPWGQPVTFVCRGPPGVHTFRLEKTRDICSHMDLTHERRDHVVSRCESFHCVNSSCISCNYVDETVVAQHGSGETEAQFCIGPVSGDSAGCYRCLYHKSQWSVSSEPLELVVISEDVSDRPPGQSPELVYIIPGVAAAFLLLLLLLLLLLHRCRKHGTPKGKGKEERQQESSILDGLPEKTPDLATVDSSPMPDRDQTSLTPAAGDPQEVTYAQLDQHTLTQRPPGAAPSQAAGPTAESCTYAALARS